MHAGAETAPRAEKSTDTSSRLQMASLVDEGLSIGRALQAVGAPADSFSGLSEDHFKFKVAHAEASLSKDGNLSEKTGTGSPQRSTGGPLG